MCRKAHVAWSLTFIPSTLCLVFLTDIRQSTQGGLLEFGGWTYGLPIALLLFGISVWWAKISGLSERIKFAMGGNVRSLWMNLLMILVLILIACFCGNTDSYYHARIHMEQAIMNNDYDEALNTSQRLVNNKPDRNITMLTAYALSKKGELAESLFEYNPSGGAMALRAIVNSLLKFLIILKISIHHIIFIYNEWIRTHMIVKHKCLLIVFGKRS